MLKPIIFPYSMKSQSAKTLAQSLGTIRVFRDRNYYHRENHLVINWGNSTDPAWNLSRTRCLNPPEKVRIACNKLKTFQKLLDCNISIPEYKMYKEEAEVWISQGEKVVCRCSLTGHSGQGIVIASSIEDLVAAPLYVQFIPKDKEYRVHVFKGQILDYQQKKKKIGYVGGDRDIRNLKNGWIYARNNISLPDNVAEESIRAVAALGLDFGAVDICTDSSNTPFVFEINTAPGLTGTTLEKYSLTFGQETTC